MQNKRFLKRLETLFFGALILCLQAAVVSAAEVEVVLQDPPEEGMVAIAFFDSENAFGDFRDPFRVERFPLDGRSSYLVGDLPAGNFAMMIYYDENGNDQMDKNFIGIPREPLGFSNAYQPKGPPSFSRAAFDLSSGEKKRFEVELYRPLGERGSIGLGLGVVGRSSPYRDYSGNVSQVIPAITYNGERLRIFGPNIEYGIFGSGDVRLALSGQFRLGAYEEDDSPFLEGMGDRESAFMAGLSLKAELAGGLDVSLDYRHDVFDKIGGGEARADLSKSFQLGLLRLSPYLAANWVSADLADHDYGVALEHVRLGRPAYEVGDFTSFEAGTGVFLEISENWLFVMNLGYEALPDEVTSSPIVDADHVVKGFGALNFAF